MIALIPRNRYLRVRMQRRLSKVSWGLHFYKFTGLWRDKPQRKTPERHPGKPRKTQQKEEGGIAQSPLIPTKKGCFITPTYFLSQA